MFGNGEQIGFFLLLFGNGKQIGFFSVVGNGKQIGFFLLFGNGKQIYDWLYKRRLNRQSKKTAIVKRRLNDNNDWIIGM